MRTLRTVLVLLAVTAGVALAAPTAAAAPPKAKAFTVSASPAASVWSQAVKLTGSITPRGGGVPRGGTVTFLADGVPVGTATATTRVTALTTTTLPPGEHALTATYSGDDRTAPGTSTAITVTVSPAPTSIRVAPTRARVPAGHRAEIKATVLATAPAAPTRRPTGKVTFTMSCKTASVALNANGVATWRAPLCPGAPGNKTVRATYTGSDQHAASAQGSTTVRLVFPDQDQQTTGDAGADVPVERHGGVVSSYAQTIAAGRTGELSDVSFGILWDSSGGAAPGPLRLTVQTVGLGGVPTGTVIGSGTVTTDAVAEGDIRFVTLALDDTATITTGLRYALVFEVDAQPADAYGRWFLWTTQGDTYAQPLHREVGGGWSPQSHDLLFTTFVYNPT
ncbi:MAG TPA: Ig-like domain-containing protein [Iamia sp.]